MAAAGVRLLQLGEPGRHPRRHARGGGVVAYVTFGRKSGKWYVHKGNSGEIIGTYEKRKDAEAELRRVHRKYRPERKNRSTAAKDREQPK